MKIVVIGGTGLIGSKVVAGLRHKDHEAIPASPASGVNSLTGEGLAEVLEGADVVVDVANSPSFEDEAVMNFFQTAGRNLLAAEAAAGVRHHVALSVVGTDRLQDSGYGRAKLAQEKLIREASTPYTIVRSTQFFEFVGGIAQSGTVGGAVHLSQAYVQPISSDDVARAVVDAAVARPRNSMIEIAGPERIRLDDFIRRYFDATHDPHDIVADPQARYFGAALDDDTLTPGKGAWIAPTRYEDWLGRATTHH